MKKKILIVIGMVISLVSLFFVSNNRDMKTKVVPYDGNNLRVSIDGVESDMLPMDGNYYLANYECSSAATIVTWDRGTNTLKVSNGAKSGNVVCNLDFQSKPKLVDVASMGSYVEYVGNNGCTGTTCSGDNANYISDNDMGYCNSSSNKFLVNGWRVAYKKGGTAYLISAGSPECVCTDQQGRSGKNCSSSEGVDNLPSHLKNLDDKALTYCNSSYAFDGVCDSNSAWNMDEIDFKMITKSNLSSVSCFSKYSDKNCGYDNDLIDNGGAYWISLVNDLNTMQLFNWYPLERQVRFSASNSSYGIRPVLRLSSTVVVVDGDGTYESPYKISNYSFEINDGSLYVTPTSFESEEVVEKSNGIMLMSQVKNTRKRSVELTLSGVDVDKMCISLNNSKCTNYIDFSEKYTLDLTGEKDGEKVVYVSYKDKLGNIVATLKQTIILDTKAPVNNRIQIALGDSLVRELTLNSVGADYMCFSNTSDKVDDCRNWIEYQEKYSWRLSDDGEKKIVYAFFKDEAGNISKVVSDSVTVVSSCLGVDKSYSIDYTGKVVRSSEVNVELCNGTYRLELWGAQGGNQGGIGGYTAGDITLTGTEELYFYVGGSGTLGSAGFNGGGSAGNTAGGGGGATDIRINEDSLYARVIVAGGGGGAGRDSCAIGAIGGGTDANGGIEQGTCGIQGGGGSQTTGGVVGTYKSVSGINEGTFGFGGNARDASFDGGAGGGGWYGGGAGVSSSWSTGGGAGSSFAYSEESRAYVPSEYLLSSNYYLTNVSILKGNDKDAPMNKNSQGNGYIRITRLS